MCSIWGSIDNAVPPPSIEVKAQADDKHDNNENIEGQQRQAIISILSKQWRRILPQFSRLRNTQMASVLLSQKSDRGNSGYQV